MNYVPLGLIPGSGYFYTAPRPGIWVSRAAEALPQRGARREPDLAGASLEELITLAHERGHELSFHRGIHEARTMREEHRAWTHAEEILRPMGLIERETFERDKELSLAEHRHRGTLE